MAGLTENGFTTQRLEDILQDYKTRAEALFADLVGTNDAVDTGSNSTLGRLIGLISPSDADIWEAMQQIYNAFDPRVATGEALDSLVALGGLSRIQEAQSTVYQINEANFNTTIPVDSQISNTINLSKFFTKEDIVFDKTGVIGIAIDVAPVANNTLYTISYTNQSGVSRIISFTSDADATKQEILEGLQDSASSGTHSPYITTFYLDGYLYIEGIDYFDYMDIVTTNNVQVVRVKKISQWTSVDYGDIQAEVNQIVQIETPVIGWLNTHNPVPAEVGNFRETDEELRARFEDSKSIRASSSVDAIFTALSEIPGVTSVKVYENDTTATDGNGIPRNSVMALVRGGDSNVVAKTIFDNKAAGISTYGNTSIDVEDLVGELHTINFETPDYQNIYIEIDITEDENFPADGEAQIVSALTEYFKSFDSGDDVIYSRLYTPINSIIGFQVNSLTVGTTASPTGTSNVVVPFNKIAYTDSNFITITS